MDRTVKQIAERVGLPSRTLRYYDRIGLVSPRERSEAGYRLYSAEDEGKLRFVRQARRVGFSLDEIGDLIAAAESGERRVLAPELSRMLEETVSEVDSRLADLGAFRERLASYQTEPGDGCGCRGHSALCGCLDDVPQSQPNRGGTDTMAETCNCGCNVPTDEERDVRSRGESEQDVRDAERRIAELERRIRELEKSAV